LSEPEVRVDCATDEEVLALLGACRSARDRFIVMAMSRVGLRRGEVCGLRREDMHFVADASGLGCAVTGAHLHVRRRANVNGAWAKSRRSRAVPVDDLVVLAYDTYVFERDRCRAADDCDFVLVNLFHRPLGVPMRPDAINELLAALSRRSGLSRSVHPHQLRHGFASNVMAAGGAVDEAQELLGHASVGSTQIYLHPSAPRLRAAVERVAVMQPLDGGGG
jgi:site-specific recombinase XerD